MGLIELIVVIVLLALLFQYAPIDQPLKNILIFVIILFVFIRLFGYLDVPLRFRY